MDVFLQRRPAIDAAQIQVRFDPDRFVRGSDAELRVPHIRLLLYDQQSTVPRTRAARGERSGNRAFADTALAGDEQQAGFDCLGADSALLGTGQSTVTGSEHLSNGQYL